MKTETPDDEKGIESETENYRETVACPSCKANEVYSRQRRRTENGLEPVDDDDRWKCRACGETFAEPETRPIIEHNHPTAKILADPEVSSWDDAREKSEQLRTDGGRDLDSSGSYRFIPDPPTWDQWVAVVLVWELAQLIVRMVVSI